MIHLHIQCCIFGTNGGKGGTGPYEQCFCQDVFQIIPDKREDTQFLPAPPPVLMLFINKDIKSPLTLQNRKFEIIETYCTVLFPMSRNPFYTQDLPSPVAI